MLRIELPAQSQTFEYEAESYLWSDWSKNGFADRFIGAFDEGVCYYDSRFFFAMSGVRHKQKEKERKLKSQNQVVAVA